MIGSIINDGMNTEYRISAQDTCLGSFFNTLSDCGDVFLRNRTADNLRFKFEGFFAVGIHRLELHLTVSVLTTSTGLLRVLAVCC